MPTAVFAASEDWGAGGAPDGDPGGHLHGGVAARIARAGRELAEMVAAREPRAGADPYADVVPFDQLLPERAR